jgi:hypothetical protein
MGGGGRGRGMGGGGREGGVRGGDGRGGGRTTFQTVPAPMYLCQRAWRISPRGTSSAPSSYRPHLPHSLIPPEERGPTNLHTMSSSSNC